MLNAETKRRLDACRDILVGKLPLPTDQIELITLALIYKFMDDLDEESVRLGGKRSFFVGPLEKYRWRALLPQTVSADERMNLFAEGIEAIGKAEHLPALFRDIFRNSFLKFRDGRILTLFLNEVNAFEYSHSEELGNAFEYLLKTMGIQAENGQFRTPRHIINFMVECLDPQPNDRILDPACGTGGFLVSAYKHILAQHTSPGSKIPGDKLTHDQRQKVYSNLTGYDVTDLMVKLSKVNLFLHGFPDPAIHIYDTLTNDARWNEKADLILANPPFMTPKGGVSPHTKFRVAAKKSEVLFTDYIAEHLTPDGRGGVIVPNGIVATMQNAYVKLRRFLVEDSLIAVISLPAGVFKPYSGVKTSILLLEKKLARQRQEILFVKVAADGFDLGDQRKPIEANDLPEAERVMKEWFAGKLKPSDLKIAFASRSELLANRHVSLSAEKLLGEPSVSGGDIPFVKLGDIASLEYGKALKEEDRTGSGFPVFGSNGEVGRHKDFIAPGPLIVIGRKGSAGAITWSQESGWPIDTTYFVALKRDDIDLKYLYWMLKKAELNRLVEQAGVPGLNRNDAYEVEIPLPPFEEQRRIVAETESYQKVIDGARQILRSYHPRFEANPGWEMVSLGELCSVQSGGTPSRDKKAYWGGSIPWVGSTVCKDCKVYGAEEFITEEGLKNSNAKLFRSKTTLIALVGATIGKTAQLEFECSTNQNIAGLFPLDEKKLLPDFLFVAVQTLYPEFLNLGEGQFRMANLAFVRSLKIPLPPLEEQQRIVTDFQAEAAQMRSVAALIPRWEAKIDYVLNRVWGNGANL
jgi:type I restriction enzyme M protein